MNAEQEKALREYLQEAIVPLIEQVLVKKLGQAMSFAVEQLIQPKRKWQKLTDDDWKHLYDEFAMGQELDEFAEAIEAKLKEKNHDPR